MGVSGIMLVSWSGGLGKVLGSRWSGRDVGIHFGGLWRCGGLGLESEWSGMVVAEEIIAPYKWCGVGGHGTGGGVERETEGNKKS